MARSHAEWKQLAAELKIEGRAFINGEYRDAAEGKRFDCVNPANGAKLAEIAHCGEADVEAAVKAAAARSNPASGPNSRRSSAPPCSSASRR
ncbi:Aldehyde dehydrogenase PuuC [Chromobacterium violaceum]|uniref:Aldehyde dehydrogenase PuuC n=1 Tax=Chromobacterium violaceum TaxID=536 RepID=A0A447TC28_CHRVL|nr:Aldehyde dehydrogenase PuuC [Chromobacterium violaceum]